MTTPDNLPAKSRPNAALARPEVRKAVRQAMNLSVAVGGTVGGAILLASNLAIVFSAQLSSIPWIPLSANAALVFGGLMFAREYRRGR